MIQVDKVIADLEAELCPIRYTMMVAGGKWKLPIICLLADGKPRRNGEIKRHLGSITSMTLSQTLKELEGYGMVTRQQYNEVPPRVEYTITKKGSSLLPALEMLAAWGRQQSGSTQCAADCNGGICTEEEGVGQND